MTLFILLFGAGLSGDLLNMMVIKSGVYLAAFLKTWKATDPKKTLAASAVPPILPAYQKKDLFQLPVSSHIRLYTLWGS